MLLLLVAGSRTAGTQAFQVRRFTLDEGLPSAQIYSITQDSLGRIWCTTRAGLAIYDGLDWRLVEHLHNEPVTASYKLARDHRGRIWLSSRQPQALLSSFRADTWLETGPPETHDLSLLDGIPANTSIGITALAVGESDGLTQVAVSLSSGGVIWGEDGSWKMLNASDGLPPEVTRGLEAEDDHVYLMTDHHLCTIHRGTVDCSLSDLLPSDVGRLLAVAPEQPGSSPGAATERAALWVLSTRGLLRIDQSTGSTTDFSLDLAIDPTQTLELLVTPFSGVYFGKSQGLFRFDRRDHHIEALSRNNGLAAAGVNSLFQDREGNLWIGSNRGLSVLISRRFATYRRRQGLLEDEVTALCQLPDGAILFGHNTGLSRLDPDGSVRRLPFEVPPSTTADPPRVMDLLVDSAGRTWIAGSTLGLGRFRADEPINWMPIFKEEGRHDSVFALVEDADGSLLLGSAYGLHRLRDGSPTRLDWDFERLGSVRRLIRTGDGSILAAASRGGVVELVEGSLSRVAAPPESRPASIFTVYGDSRDLIWVGSTRGLLLYDDGELTPPPERVLRFTQPVYLILEDPTGSMWFGTDNGLLRWDGARLRSFTVHQGFAGRETNRAAALVDHRLRLWFGSDAGVSCYHAADDHPPPPPPHPMIVGVEHGAAGITQDRALRLSHGAGTVTYHFAAFSARAADQLHYRSRLLGFENEWSDAFSGRQRSQRFTNLPPGHYTFSVQARLADGPWSAAATAHRLDILPPWWQNWWAVLGLLASGLALFYMSSHMVSRWRRTTRLELEVSRRRAAEERSRAILGALEESRANFASIVEAHVDGILVVDEQRVVRFANDAACQLLSSSRFELEGHPCRLPISTDTVLEMPVHHAEVDEGIAEIRTLATEWQGENVHLLLIRDITESRSTEDQLRQSQKLEAVGRLAGGVAHDFNNLLQAILSTLEALQLAPSDGSSVPALVAEMKSHVAQGSALTRRLLQFSRPTTSEHELLDLNLTIQDNLKMLRRLVRENISFEVTLAGEALSIEADRHQISQVLTNLVVNACDAMPEGGRLSIRTGSSGQEQVYFEVADTGIGIPEALRDKVFEPFFSTKDKARGTGLGLSVVHGIVTHHGGYVSAESREGKGSCFRITLPSADHALGEPPQEGDDTRDALYLGEGERLLLVEDDSSIRKGLATILTRIGYEVVQAGSAEEAEELPERPGFDLLLSDLVLPGKRGDELAHSLRRRWPRLSVVIMSGYTEDQAVQEALQVEASSLLLKPFAIDRLTQVLREALDPESSSSGVVFREAEVAPSDAEELDVRVAQRTAMVPARILVIEDQEILLRIITRSLEQMGYQARAYRSAEQALDELVPDSPVDLVITDIDLPGMSGTELCQRVRAARPSLPFILCSGNPELLQSKACAGKSALYVLAKPFEVAELKSAVETLLASAHADAGVTR